MPVHTLTEREVSTVEEVIKDIISEAKGICSYLGSFKF